MNDHDRLTQRVNAALVGVDPKEAAACARRSRTTRPATASAR